MTFEFQHWSLEKQREYLSSELQAETLPDLLLLCSEQPDTSPLLFLMKTAQERGFTFGPSLGEVLLKLSTSSLQKLLQLPGLEVPVKEAWSRASVDQLVSFALLDRYLRRRAPHEWRRGLDQVAQTVEQKMVAEDPPDHSLILRLEGCEQKRLQSTYPKHWSQWSEAWTVNSKKAIQHLAARPRGVSLANAEKLLSQQVYTDQGHFLLELLQNADDAGASEFEVRFATDSITVIHNGVPFDFRDLVGVLSIGQTTKTERQIGYFGVGFKSVFEVTDRPCITSGHFAFEIIDISIPRYLVSQPDPQGKTVLVLPLKEGLQVEPYYERALDIEKTLLLNLPNVKTLRWASPKGEVTVLSQSQNGSFHRLSKDQWSTDYLVWEGLYEHTGQRPEGKPKEAKVMLAFPQGEEAVTPDQNLFSFLPIQENSGLRFLVGSHFDVPVDRERLDQTSPWNKGILGQIPTIIGEACEQSPESVVGLLPRLPLPADPVGPLFGLLASSIAERLRGLAFVSIRDLASGDTRWRKPSQTQVLDDDLIPFFSVDEKRAFLTPSDERTRLWFAELGARTYELRSLLVDLARGKTPGGLRQANLEKWTHLHKLLLQSPNFEAWQLKLRTVPIFLDQHGKLASAQDLSLLPLEWSGIFSEAPRTIWPELMKVPETETLVASLRVRTLEWKDLLCQLRDHGLQRVNFDALIEELTKAPKSIQMTFFRLPLFYDLKGQRTALALPKTNGPGALITASDTPTGLFTELSFCTQTELLEPLLEAFGWPRFGRSEALAYLSAEDWKPREEGAQVFRDWLLKSQPEWATLEDLVRLAGLPIFESSDGPLCALQHLWNYEEEELSSLLPDLPQLRPHSSSERLVEHFGLQHLLGQANLNTLIERFEESDPEAVLELLGRKAEALSRQQIAKLLNRPIVGGRTVAHPDKPLETNSIEVAEPEFVEILLRLGVEVADLETSRKLLPLMKAAGYPLLGLQRLIGALRETVPPADCLPQLHQVLLSKSVELLFGFSETVLQSIPLWECADGQVRPTNLLPPNQELTELFNLASHEVNPGQSDELAEMFPRLEPLEYVVGFVRQYVKPGAPLSAQPEWFNTVSKVDAVSAHLTQHVLCVDVKSQVRDSRLLFAPAPSHTWLRDEVPGDDLLHPESSEAQIQGSIPMKASEILGYFLPRFRDEPVRAAFYEYLQNHLGQIVREPAARQFLLNQEIWRSAGGNWRSLDELILEPGVPDLGFDWYPHSELPSDLVDQLRTTLDVGRPNPLTLFQTLLPAYREAIDLGRPVDDLMQLMAKVSETLTGAEMRDAVQEAYSGGEFLLRDASQTIALSQAYAVPPSLVPLSSVPAQSGGRVVFLRKLGLPYLPSVGRLEQISHLPNHDALALERLVAWVWEERSQDLQGHLEFLGSWSWMCDRTGNLRAPLQLYVPSSEVEELIGLRPELYPQGTLPLGLWRALGMRGEKEVELPQVLSFLKRRIEREERIGSRFYQFLEEALTQGRVAPNFLRASFQDLPWIWTDEAHYRNHRQVLGYPAYRYFGTYRGTWEMATSRYPKLTSFFEIPGQLTPDVVLKFLKEVAEKQHPDCSHRLLLNGLAFLGERGSAVPSDWDIIPARELPSLQMTLVSSNRAGVVRSNSPTLAALFGRGGKLWVVETDDPEHGETLDALYQRLGIPQLRDAYTVEPDDSGRDVTEELGQQVVAFRQLLGAIDRVLPRLRAARPEWLEGDWLADSQLRPFAATASIRVIEGLQLIYEMNGISKVLVTAAVAYDPDGQRLLVSSDAVKEPRRYAVDLADGLSECIYQGPGSENLVDLLNLLLLFGTENQMNAYLDQRHFPRPFDPRGQNAEPWRLRLGEILDYGLHRALERRFPELEGAHWNRWRDAGWQPEDPTPVSLLRGIGVSQPTDELLDALDDLMTGEQLRLPSQESEAIVVSEEEPPAVPAESFQVDKSAEGSLFSKFRKSLVKKLSDLLSTDTTQAPSIRLRQVPLQLADSYQHPPERHLLYSDNSLRDAQRYCLELLCSNFDAQSQEYKVGWSQWNPIFIPTGRTVQFSGSLTVGDLPLAMPLYSKLAGSSIEGGESRLVGPDGFHLYRLDPPSTEIRISYDVELSDTPEYREMGALTDFDPRLISTTVTLNKLPPDLRQWIDWARGSKLPHWQLADRANEFIRASYQYDLNYLASEAALHVAQEPLRGGENRFLDVLHAGAGGRFLGRGVCGELSAILLEVLRHCQVPCAMARVWMLDQSLIHVPDHAIVLVLVPSAMGPYWIPLDPSGERVMQEQKHPEKLLTRMDLLEKAVQMLLPGLQGLPNSTDRRQRFLQDKLLDLFGHSELLELFLDCLAKPGALRKELSPEMVELYERGFLSVNRQELYEIWVAERV
jgi:hypothetical protein